MKLKVKTKIKTVMSRILIVPGKPLVVQTALSWFITKVRQIDLPFIDKLQSHFLRSLNGLKSPAISGIQTKLNPEHGPLAVRVSWCRVRASLPDGQGPQVQSGVELSSRAILITSPKESYGQSGTISWIAALAQHPQIQVVPPMK